MESQGMIRNMGTWLRAIALAALILTLSVALAIPLNAWCASLAGWVQGIGTVAAIVAGFAGVQLQVRQQEKDKLRADRVLGQAAYMLAFESFYLITDRLNGALSPGQKGRVYELRGYRTTEMVNAMRETEAARFPTCIIVDFSQLRSLVFAINCRISDLYAAEDDDPSLASFRYGKLKGAVSAHKLARETFERLTITSARELQAEKKTLLTPYSILNYSTEM